MSVNPKCSACQRYFLSTLKLLAYHIRRVKATERCRKHDKKWRDTHQEHMKEYKEIYNEENKEAIKEKRKEYYQVNKKRLQKT